MFSCAGRKMLKRYLNGELSAAASEDVTVHLEGCAACQHLLDQMTNEGPALMRAASIRKREELDEEPKPEFLERLRDALSETIPPPDVLRARAWAESGSGDRDKLTGRRGRHVIAPSSMTVAGYEILDELSRGGMGIVYRARQVGLNRLVALKMILAGDRARAADRIRFHTEAEAVARLQHPNIVQIYDIGECDGSPYFSMELVNGPTLARACGGRPQPSRSSATLVETLARAVHCAHQQGILHRDLKPANVLLQPVVAGDGISDVQGGASPTLSSEIWTPKLADFGLAKRLDDASLTQRGLILGTPSYMAPEQVMDKGRALGAGVDVYALGAILYELLTGRPPFVAGSIESTLAIVANEDPIPPRRLQPDVPRDLETVCLKCLEKEPARRYASAEDLADDLGRFGDGEPVRARAPSTLDRWYKLARRHVAVVAGVAGVIVALALGLATAGVMAVRESQARLRADRNADLATESARAAKAAGTAALRDAYRARLAAAMVAMGHRDTREAARQLEAAPVELRGWEWRHLQGRLDQSLAVVAGLSATAPVAFCPAGRLLAVADPRGYRLLDAATGTCLAPRHTDHPCRQVFAFMTSRGPRFVLDQSAEMLSLALTDGDGRLLSRIDLPEAYRPGEQPDRLVMAMSRDGKRLAFQSSRSETAPLIEVFDTADGRRIGAGGNLGARLLALDFSPDGGRLAVVMSESSQVFVFDAATTQRVATLSGHVGAVASVAYSPDGARLATCGDDEIIRLWDSGTGKLLLGLRGHSGRVSCVAFGPDGRELASGGSDGSIRVWRAGDDAALELHGHTATVTRLAFSSDGRTIASISDDGTARLWDAMTQEEACVLRGHASYVYPVASSPDGRWFASGAWDGTVRLWNAASGRAAHKLEGHAQPVGALAFTHDGTRLASWGEDRTIRLWETVTGEEIGPRLTHQSMGHRDSVYSLVVSPDGRRIGAVTSGEIRFWDLATRAEVAPMRLPIASVRVVAFSSDGSLLAAGGDEPWVAVVNAASGELMTAITGFQGRIQSLAFSPDGRRVLTAGKDPTLRLWDAATGRLVQTFAGHDQEVLSAIFHPDGTRIASGGHDRSIRIWDVATGDELVRLPGHTWYVFSLAFSPDGRTLVSGSGDSTVRLWDDFPVAHRLRTRRASERNGGQNN